MNHNQLDSQIVLTTFFEDIRAFIQDQVKNINLNQKSIDFINTTKFDSLLLQLELLQKKI